MGSAETGPGKARGSEMIRGRALASTAMVRVVTLVVSGVPTVVAWALMSKRLDATDFSGVSLALSLPTVSSFILPAMGARIANAVASGQDAFEDAIVRSVRACVAAGAILIVVTAGLAVIGWSRLLGRQQPDQFPMGAALIFVSVAIALWIVLLIGERVLIARGEVTKRILASAVTGPVALAGVWIVAVVHGPAWAYVLPIPCSMVLAAACSLVWALRLPGIRWRAILSAVWRRPSESFGRSSLTVWLILVEGSIVIPIWLLRPVVSLRGSDADVAALSVALQFATPVLSLLGVLGQGLWPFYAHNRLSLGRRDVLRHTAVMASVGVGLAACYSLGLDALFRLEVVGHRATTGMLVAMALYIVARAAWEPVRIVFSTDQTAGRLAWLCLVICVITVAAMWPLGGLAHGALAVTAVAAAFAAISLVATATLMELLHSSPDQEVTGEPGSARPMSSPSE